MNILHVTILKPVDFGVEKSIITNTYVCDSASMFNSVLANVTCL